MSVILKLQKYKLTKGQKKRLWQIIPAAMLFAVSFGVRSFENIINIILLISYLIAGGGVLVSAVRKIFSGQLFDEEFLMALATVGAIAIGEIHEAVTVMLLYQTGELFQSIAVGKSRRSIKALIKIKPDTVTVIRDGMEITEKPENVLKDEIILVIPGERVGLDGEIVDGATSFDSSSLTGESAPVSRGVGEKAVSGMINLESPVKIRVSGAYAESTVAKILNLVEMSSARKATAEKFITKFSKKYTPCVVVLALLTAFLPVLFGQPFGRWLKRALVLLVVSCPCALVISVPLSFFASIGAASKKGILIKGSNYIEILSKANKIAFDKTGTLTSGSFTVTEVSAMNNDEEQLLEIAALAESFSNHPLAYAVLNAYGKPLGKERVSDVINIPGQGIKAVIDGKRVLLGNSLLMENSGIGCKNKKAFGTVIHLAIENEYAGYLLLEDKIKQDAFTAISDLKKFGVKRVVMLSGDSEKVAAKIGEQSGISEIYAELLPEDKVNIAMKIKSAGEGKFAFAGDGINDAPVLACADVGIAMGAMGSDAAIEAADVVIMNDSLSALTETLKIAKKTMMIVKQNVVFSLLVKFGVMIFSILGFDNMYAAIFADVGVMVLAVLNAMRCGK